MSLVDSHAHLDDYEDREAVIARAREAGVSRVVLIGLWRGPGDFGTAHALAAERPELFAPTAGVHPHECARVAGADWDRLAELAALPETVAVGETGLDYHYDHSPRDEQRAAFRRQLDLARSVHKPVVVHTREADDDTIAMLREAAPEKGVIHCFTGGPDRARAYLDLGLFISVAGVVTFRNAEDLREAVRLVPLDRLLIETDSPFLAPVPLRGRRNEPAHVKLVAEAVAALKGVSTDELALRTAQNATAIFGL